MIHSKKRSPGLAVAETAQYLVIGGGLEGLAIAWSLAERGETDGLGVERDSLCSGMTGKPSAVVRCHYGSESPAGVARPTRPALRSPLPHAHWASGAARTHRLDRCWRTPTDRSTVLSWPTAPKSTPPPSFWPQDRGHRRSPRPSGSTSRSGRNAPRLSSSTRGGRP